MIDQTGYHKCHLNNYIINWRKY